MQILITNHKLTLDNISFDNGNYKKDRRTKT